MEGRGDAGSAVATATSVGERACPPGGLTMAATQEQVTTYTDILVKYDAPLATITMNRPERRNALSVPMMTEMTAALTAIGHSKDIQVVILAANGPAFSAGHDLSELVDGDLTAYRHVFDVCTELMETIQA